MISRVSTRIAVVLVAGFLFAGLVGADGNQGPETGGQGPGAAARAPNQQALRTADPTGSAASPSCTTARCHATIKQFSRVHPPVAEDQCDVCHEPTRGATPFQAGARHEFKRAGDNADLCYECHDELTEEAIVHKPVRQGLCILCHDPHGSEKASLLRVTANRTLCAQCHRITFDQGKSVLHKPVAEGKCLDCHEHHGGDSRKLLRGNFTAEPYESFGLSHYKLCYRCHDPRQVTEPTTTSATGFRNGDVNLHFKHVNRAEKGRTCRICHEVHASTAPKLIREKTPFGRWQLPLNFKRTETGGSCLPGCHRTKGYDRVHPIRNK